LASNGDAGAYGENAEREAAYERGRLRRLGDCAEREAVREEARAANPAFAALAENVRDYAIFLLDPEGVITYWGEGAHLLKGWSLDEAEGAHLRLLYPEGGSDDGTAEAHLRQSAERGEYTGEGCRVRRDRSTFWAHITLTALRDPAGELFGFVKVTRDMSARRATEAALASSASAHSDRDRALSQARDAEAARDRAEETAEFERERARGASDYMAHRDTEAQR
jgi:PAS domain S-box-containing protein